MSSEFTQKANRMLIVIIIAFSFIMHFSFLSKVQENTIFNVDEGVYILQLESWKEHGISKDIKLSASSELIKDLWKNNQFPLFAKLIAYVEETDQYYSYYALPYIVMVYPFYKHFGLAGAHFVSLIFVLLTSFLFMWYIKKRGFLENSQWVAAAIFFIGWPFIYYGHYIGGQAAGMFFGLSGFFLLDLHFRNISSCSLKKLLLAGMLMGLSIPMRDEYYIFVISSFLYFVYLLYTNRNRYDKSLLIKELLFISIGFLITAGGFTLYNIILYSNIWGARGFGHTVSIAVARTTRGVTSWMVRPMAIVKLHFFYQSFTLFVFIGLLFKSTRKLTFGYVLYYLSFWTIGLIMFDGIGGTTISARSVMPLVPISLICIFDILKLVDSSKAKKIIFYLFLLSAGVSMYVNLNIGFNFFNYMRIQNDKLHTELMKYSDKPIFVEEGYSAILAPLHLYNNANMAAGGFDNEGMEMIVESMKKHNLNEFYYLRWILSHVPLTYQEGVYSVSGHNLILKDYEIINDDHLIIKFLIE